MPKTLTSKVEVVESSGEHWYKSPKKDIYHPSVTTYLSIWPRGVGFERYLANAQSWESTQETLKNAGKRGTRVHEATQLLEEGLELQRETYTLDEWQLLMAFVKWHHEFAPKVVFIEKSLVSDKLKTGGTCDRIYEIGGATTLLDIKTSSAIHENYYVQVAVYAKLAELELKIPIEQTAILRLTDRRKDGYEFKVRNKEEWHNDFKLFKPIQELWNHINPDAQPKILEVPTTLKL